MNRLLLFFIWCFAVSLFADEYSFDTSQIAELQKAIVKAQDDDVFILASDGEYLFGSSLSIGASVTIRSLDMKNPATIVLETSDPLFEMQDEASLTLQGVDFDVSNSALGFCIVKAYAKYSFKAVNVHFRNVPYIFSNVKSAKGESILLENVFLYKSALFEGHQNSFNILDLHNCVFTESNDPAIVAQGINNASFTANHCVFDRAAVNDTLIIISETDQCSIINSSFSNNSYSAILSLSGSRVFDYNNIYNSIDLGSSTGANCTYYDPSYDDLFLSGNPSLENKANDGENIGAFTWTYTFVDAIDLGDNPYNFKNQGTWIIPEVGESGLWESYFVKNVNGTLWYREDPLGNKIPDFSYCGYNMGNTSSPTVAVVATIYPMLGDATSYIQNVIDSVAQNVSLDANGFRGAILLKAGEYFVSSALIISHSGIVLRGEGQSQDAGTRLIATSTSGNVDNKTHLISIGASSGSLSRSNSKNINVPFIPVGAKYVIVEDGHAFSVEDEIVISQVFNDALISALEMDQIPDRTDGGSVSQWDASDYSFYYERTVTRISDAGIHGDSVFFNNPIVNALDHNYNALRQVSRASFTQRICHSGVENMHLESVYASETDENHAWNAIFFNRAQHCWAKDITSRYFAFALANMSKYSKYISVESCKALSPKSQVTGSRRYSFNLDGQMCLVKNCYASEGRHDYVQGSRVCGPNAVVNCESFNSSNDIGPHHRWSTGTLYDNVTSDGAMNVRDRGSYGSGHGWAGANMVFWNCEGDAAICQNPQVYAQNYNIAFRGDYVDDIQYGNRPRGHWEGNNVIGINIPSLYAAQLTDRGLLNEFGLLNQDLIFVNDSTFRLNFNEALEINSATDTGNYSLSSTTELGLHPIAVSLVSEAMIELVFSSAGVLNYNTRIDIDVSNVVSLDGKVMNGNAKAYLLVPDNRPTVSLTNQTTDNSISGEISVSSSKDGDVYLALVNVIPQSIFDLDREILNQKVSKTSDVMADEKVAINTYSLLPGLYYAYAADTEGRLSAKSREFVIISSTSDVDAHSDHTDLIKKCYVNKGILYLVCNTDEPYHIELFNLLGQLKVSGQYYSKNSAIELTDNDPVLMIRLVCNGQIVYKKICCYSQAL